MSSHTEWSLISAGDNYYGQLGRGGDEEIPNPVENLPKKNLSCISTGYYHSVALYKDGSVFGWGDNYNGCLGFPEEVEKVEFPTKINGLLLTKKGETYGMSLKKLRPDDFVKDSKVVCESEDYFSLIESLRDVKIIKISVVFRK
ncbi:hypothetical protein TRFO_36171 [Tritrichomonas foetus]|uniref:Uncharacterized protein n=1 Tax=Tritrichomonas foetus TaxID=1144522 RepID=A0A1J4JEN1_9EUKA|nr:hypothetical protein TRFO_36171 [Tritrichomonas foetus]|eukprot:OHS97568.1 hypothetical protein TRFO_36171 [Tritrichomonas foetus]